MKLILVLALCATAAADPRPPDRVPSLEGPPSIAYILRPPAVDPTMAIAPPIVDPDILLGGVPSLFAQVTDALSRAVHWLIPAAT